MEEKAVIEFVTLRAATLRETEDRVIAIILEYADENDRLKADIVALQKRVIELQEQKKDLLTQSWSRAPHMEDDEP